MVQIIVGRLLGVKPLLEPMMALFTDAYMRHSVLKSLQQNMTYLPKIYTRFTLCNILLRFGACRFYPNWLLQQSNPEGCQNNHDETNRVHSLWDIFHDLKLMHLSDWKELHNLHSKMVMSPGGHLCCYYPGTLSTSSSDCNSFVDRVPVDWIYGCPIFKWVAASWLNETVPVDHSR